MPESRAWPRQKLNQIELVSLRLQFLAFLMGFNQIQIKGNSVKSFESYYYDIDKIILLFLQELHLKCVTCAHNLNLCILPYVLSVKCYLEPLMFSQIFTSIIYVLFCGFFSSSLDNFLAFPFSLNFPSKFKRTCLKT